MQGSEKLRLPVPPGNYSIKGSNNNSSFSVENFGEVSFLGKTNLCEIGVIETFFPNKNYTFCQYLEFPKPWDCVNLIEKWRVSGKPIRYIITDTPINIACSIESFEYKENDGTGDISFSLQLKEYRIIDATTRKFNSLSNGYQNVTFLAADIAAVNKRPIDKQTPTQYTVKKGDTLYLIAKKVYGDGSKWQELAEKNLIKDPTDIPEGTVLKL
ncbi:LysM peptidoglycan-binding domain-containing protein [Clostridium sp. AWRP]|nr:LysM peptidoglycan-binding domain-containing protein [Clostridium sp. AWRP]